MPPILTRMPSRVPSCQKGPKVSVLSNTAAGNSRRISPFGSSSSADTLSWTRSAHKVLCASTASFGPSPTDAARTRSTMAGSFSSSTSMAQSALPSSTRRKWTLSSLPNTFANCRRYSANRAIGNVCGVDSRIVKWNSLLAISMLPVLWYTSTGASGFGVRSTKSTRNSPTD